MSDQRTPVYSVGEHESDEPRMSALAVVGLVCSLICLIPALPLIGAALGGAALLKINSSGGRLAGVGMALVAISVGAVQSALDFGLQPVYGDEAAPKNEGPAEAGSAAPSGAPAQEQR